MSLQLGFNYYFRKNKQLCSQVSAKQMSHKIRKRSVEHMRPSEDSDQPAHSRSLIRILTACSLNSQECNLFFMRTTKTDQTAHYAQADLSLRWANLSEGTLSH